MTHGELINSCIPAAQARFQWEPIIVGAIAAHPSESIVGSIASHDAATGMTTLSFYHQPDCAFPHVELFNPNTLRDICLEAKIRLETGLPDSFKIDRVL